MAYVSTFEAVPAAMILRMTVSEANTAPAVVMAPTGAMPVSDEPPMTTAACGCVVAKAPGVPIETFPTGATNDPAVDVMAPVVDVMPVPAVMVVVDESAPVAADGVPVENEWTSVPATYISTTPFTMSRQRPV